LNLLKRRIERIRKHTRISKAGRIARRAFVNNFFDGVLTMIGVVMGSFFVGVQDTSIVLVIGLSTALAIGISGGWGAYLIESVERRKEIRKLEQVALTNLRDTKVGEASRMAVVMVAVVDGFSPFFAALLVVLPFFFEPLLPSIDYAYYASIGIALLSLFGLGSYLGSISRQKIVISGIKTAVAGMVCVGLSYLLEQIVP
jgi:predicted membrane protein (TIGR00267 family)